MTTRYVAILGTNGWPSEPAQQHAEWWYPTSPFGRYLKSLDLLPAREDKPFVWSGDLEGIPILASGKDWEAGAESLGYYLDALPFEDRNLIAHSHGGQVALIAAANGVQMRSLIMVATPVRKDIERHIAPAAVKNIGVCRHLYDPKWDTIGLLGAAFDFRLSMRRKFQVAGIVAEGVPGMSHSNVLRDPALFPLWQSRGWLDLLRGVWSSATV